MHISVQSKMFFDWYQATIFDDEQAVLDSIAKLGHGIIPNRGIARMYHYDQGYQIQSNFGIVATVLIGGNGKYPHAFATSDNAPAFADLVRTEWPNKHRVTRVDATTDFHEFGSYDRLRSVCKEISKGFGLQFAQHSDELNRYAGRTQYIGSKTSEYRSRLYEKGLQIVGQLPEVRNGSLCPADITVCHSTEGVSIRAPDWSRLELQARPKYEDGKLLAATLSPEEIWGMSKWTLELANKALALDLERVYIRAKRDSSDEKAFRAMVSQYANVLTRLRIDLGDWESVGLTIGDALVEIKKKPKSYY